jgi:hypothetical protein
MSKLLEWLELACSALNLDLDINYSIDMNSGQSLVALARIRNIGAKNGMLIISSSNQVAQFVSQLSIMGYGFAVLDEPRPDEDFNLESFREMFGDWGYTECSDFLRSIN